MDIKNQNLEKLKNSKKISKMLVRCCCVCHDLFIDSKWVKSPELYDQLYEKYKLTHGVCPECLEDKLLELEFIYPRRIYEKR